MIPFGPAGALAHRALTRDPGPCVEKGIIPP
jgi:hypothetical protein